MLCESFACQQKATFLDLVEKVKALYALSRRRDMLFGHGYGKIENEYRLT